MIFLMTVTGCSEGQKKANNGNVGQTTVLNMGVYTCPGQTNVVRMLGHLYLRLITVRLSDNNDRLDSTLTACQVHISGTRVEI